MGVQKSVNLKGAKKSKDDDREGVGPERVEPECRNEQGFDETVREKIERREVFASVGKVFRGPIEMHGDELVAIERQIDFEKFQSDPVQIERLNRP